VEVKKLGLTVPARSAIPRGRRLEAYEKRHRPQQPFFYRYAKRAYI